MKVLVVGSRKAHDTLEFRNGCQAVGRALAKRGHTIVAAGCGDDDAETWILESANSAATASKKPKLIPFSPAIPETTDLIQAINIALRWPNVLVLRPFETKGPWAVGQAVALLRSDVALLIGGGVLTANVGSLALEVGKPYYAIAKLGGAAKVMADEEYAKYRTLGMPEDLLRPSPADGLFGHKVVSAIEFLTRRQRNVNELRSNAIILAASVTVLALFLGFVFRTDPFGNEPRLVYTTCLGAIVGVILSFLTGHVFNRNTITLPKFLGQTSLACFLGALYGFFSLEAGGLYKVDIARMQPSDVDSLAIKVALVGVGVGALLGPASKRALEDLRRTSSLPADHTDE